MTVSGDEARRLALSLPGTVERDHHGRASFRIADRIFATLWDAAHMNVMLDEGGILTAVEAAPTVCEEVWWGMRLRAVRVNLELVEPDTLTDLLTDAWEQKAPRGARG